MSERSPEGIQTPDQRAFAALEEFSRGAIEAVRQELITKYGPAGLDYAYHNLPHTERAARVYEAFAALAKQVGLADDMDVLAGRLAIWFHDSVMDSEVITSDTAGPNDDVGGRKRAVGQNEQNSFLNLAGKLDQFFAEQERDRSEDGEFLYALRRGIDTVKAIAKEAIMATEPGFDPFASVEREDMDKPGSVIPAELRDRLFSQLLAAPPKDKPLFLKIYQKNLTSESSITAFNVAVADLAQVGQMTPEEFAKSGDSELWELKPYVKAAYENIESIDDPEQLRKLATTVVNWVDSQPGFIYWQWQQAFDYLMNNTARFGKQIQEAGHDLREVVVQYRDLLPNFANNLNVAITRAETLRGEYEFLKDEGAFVGENLVVNRQKLHELIALTNPTRA